MLGAGQGSDWNASSTNIQQPVTGQQADQTYQQAQNAYGQQQSFLNALQGQHGISNQSDVYNQLAMQAAGQGPNPAQAQLANATGANVQNQAALMAGQRGASANAGLIARQAGMQGANTQQQSAGQAAALQAQQSANAINSMGNLATQQVAQQQGATQGLNQLAQNEQSNILGGIAAQNNAIAGLQSNMNTANSNIQIQNSKAQQGLFGGLLGGAGSMLAKGGVVGQPKMMADGGMMSPSPTVQINTPTMASTALPTSNVGKFLNGVSSPIAGIGGSSNGESAPVNSGAATLGKGIMKQIQGAPAAPGQTLGPNQGPQLPSAPTNAMPDANAIAPTGEIGEAGVADLGATAAEGVGADVAADEAAGSGVEGLLALVAHGGTIKGHKKVPALVSPGEVYLNPGKAKEVVNKKEDPMKAGKHIPGKAKFKGDNYGNDTVPAKLDEGGIVIPRSITEGPNAKEKAYAFVAAHMRQLPMRKKKR